MSFHMYLIYSYKRGKSTRCAGSFFPQKAFFMIFFSSLYRQFWYTVSFISAIFNFEPCTGHCASIRKVALSIPYGVTGIFHWQNPSGRTMALGLTQPLTEMSTRNISCGVKAAGAYDWQPYHLHVLIVLKSGSLNLLEISGSVQACNGIALPFYHVLVFTSYHWCII